MSTREVWLWALAAWVLSAVGFILAATIAPGAINMGVAMLIVAVIATLFAV